ncbi:MAG TPA: nucleotide pyrophosphohydrolase [Clostridiales bacterium UBA8960]|nr:nucleotide pyrophosphohydrolase [Clostridiales bacterium UBA8960]
MESLLNSILTFRNARDWKQFHTPENLAKSISIEAAELLEHFQWDGDYDLNELSDELADVLIYAFLMAEAIGVDIERVMLNKLEKNKSRFPVEAVKGNSGKYTRVD